MGITHVPPIATAEQGALAESAVQETITDLGDVEDIALPLVEGTATRVFARLDTDGGTLSFMTTEAGDYAETTLLLTSDADGTKEIGVEGTPSWFSEEIALAPETGQTIILMAVWDGSSVHLTAQVSEVPA